jgi:ATP-dependent RNA helicase DeaD
MPANSKPANASAASSSGFARFALARPLLQTIAELGYEAPYPIQDAAIPPLLEGRDLLGQAQTGTGKTAAFALPILARLDLAARTPQALVLTPTRELAIQVAEAMQTYARHLPGFHVLPVYGGQHIEVQLRQLQRGVHVVIGTPGRLLDHLRRKTLHLDSLRTVVIDEADEMLRMGFLDEVQAVLDHTPPDKQVALFSATFPEAISRVARRYLRQPVEVRIATATTTVAATTQRYWQVSGTHKLDALTRILETEEFDAMLVFVRTRVATDELTEKLEARGFAAAALSGDMSQAQREKTIERLRRGTLDIVVATDVAARGLDVERVSHVINYDVPFDAEAYIHRIGRTGRAGRKGDAILFVAPRERPMLAAIERATRQPIARMNLPSREDITGKRVTRFKQRLSETIESQDLTFFHEVVLGYQRDHGTDLDQIAAALAYLVQRERPLQPPAADFRAESAPPAKPDAERPGVAARPTRHAPRPTAPAPQRPRPAVEPARRADRDAAPLPAGTVAPAGRERYRLEVGSAHGVKVGNIVGALANEAALDGRDIGPVKLYDAFTLVDLPAGMAPGLIERLRKVWVGGRQLQIRLLSEVGLEAATIPSSRTTHRATKSGKKRSD